MISHCLLKLNIDWVTFLQPHTDYNVLHLLVRARKVGSLIQILKLLSGARLEFITNQHVLSLLKEQESSIVNQEDNEECPLDILLRKMLNHKDSEGFDPYHLALLLKDASCSRLLEEKLSQQKGSYKSEFDVKDYSIRLETDPVLLEQFQKGFELEGQLE